MATDFFLRPLASSVGGAGGRVASQMRGRSTTSAITTTTASGTNIPVTATAGGQALTWFTEPITVQVTIPATAGQVTPFIRAFESVATVNAGVAITIDRCDNSGTVLSNILTTAAIGAELGTSQAVRTLSYSVTATTMNVGERIKFTLRIVNVGTMDVGTATVIYDGPAGSASGDTFIRFVPNIITDEIIEINQFQGGGFYGYN
jgi:hypothetical protein